jgi:lipopolysaccharide/colanic/teichoic acid biosynthesis glycosyltransferase
MSWGSEFDRWFKSVDRETPSFYAPLHTFSKRLLDISFSALILLLALPLICLLAIAVKLDSPGPVFFIQQRVGAKRVKNDLGYGWQTQQFPCFKFRSMHWNADTTIHQEYMRALINKDEQSMEKIQGMKTSKRKLVHDPRITRVGNLLRRTSLDELPQFVNVLRGEMSVVGPRPAIPYELEFYQDWHFERLQALPGITGLWQITRRSASDFDEMVRLDIEYIRHPSLWTDFRIILSTPFVMLKGAH